MNGSAASAQPNLHRVGGHREKKHFAALRVLTLTPFYPTAIDDAAGCFVAEPLRGISEFGVHSCVVVAQPWHRSLAGADVRTPAATWIRYPSVPWGIGLASAGAFLYARLISRIRNLHRSQRIDLIHAHAALPCGYAAARLRQQLDIPFVVTV